MTSSYAQMWIFILSISIGYETFLRVEFLSIFVDAREREKRGMGAEIQFQEGEKFRSWMMMRVRDDVTVSVTEMYR